ncbi:hydroxymethylglutaryl-CoA lyase [Cocleimonas sp. KMM 6892]|uniref:hydroxymethylglutaryl-CoA lyase n=1 Tax=unclassified Cocleimonas TaxID=2639732 RepID=UPI002DBE2826|nr:MULTISPECIES: hydroxymethylglutaryl-CoA lyase [unclassified Cocleimonas]MEB8434329.1 hydroxymethylglutaryl-CoA lyase [Cocleimonas sp. KMM 6892]MEC4717268.1 hydroxymethylglutaryl-CoA lyase [Cocleimonas sp. KMM 6895]MEC4746647.1 hydroxymethylglutaryl-CoA lyase [Cocleimonas sp. KMM 6896]
MSLPSKVKIVEVGARDGLQNESTPVSVDVKISLIEKLADAGLPVVEAASFVSPKWVPQMAGSVDVFKGIKQKANVNYPALVPNIRGLESALESGVKEIAVFAAASESFTQKNINCSIEESINRYTEVIEKALENDLKVRGYVSCTLGCPYEGEIASEKVAEVSKRLSDLGCYEISLGDTIGTGTPIKAQQMIETVAKYIPMPQLAAHFHDTYGQALANLFAVLQLGVSTIDSSVSGLGGCPYAKGATGNVATEDVIYMLNGMGIETGVDLDKLLEAGRFISDQLGRKPNSNVGLARYV